MPDLLRLLDAAGNRAREGLRLLEDYARFVLDDPALTAELKQLRHTLARAIPPQAILHRDTPHDVGTALKTESELIRADLPHLITANAKRLGEALRSIEEYLKVDRPADAAGIEQARYAFYDLEQRLARTLRPPNARLAAVHLCVLITESACRTDWLATARAALEGGAEMLQLREKDIDARELLRRARVLRTLTRDHDALLIINDRPDVALLSDADGLHLGQSDLPAVEARKLLGQNKLIGVSTHALQDAQQARLDGADYIGAGPVFRSPTKPRDITPGLPYLRELASYPLPVLAIAGVTPANVGEVLATGVRRIAVTAAATQAPDVAWACRELRAMLGRIPTAPRGVAQLNQNAQREL